MYDISFILCVSKSVSSMTTGEDRDYFEILKRFRKYGFFNWQNKKIKLFLLVGNEKIEDIEKHWEFDIEIIESSFWHTAPKTYEFYANLNQDKINTSRWFMKLDDDSSTNVSALIDQLDEDFDYKKKYNITGTYSNVSITRGKNRIQDDMCMSLIEEIPSYKNKINNTSKELLFRHEWEHQILSQTALRYILQKEENIKILLSSLRYGNAGHSDHLMSLCSNFSGIPFCQVPYTTHLPFLDEFLRGSVLHIHYLYNRDMGGSDIVMKILDKKNKEIPKKYID